MWSFIEFMVHVILAGEWDTRVKFNLNFAFNPE